ncbi:MAG TPA: HAD family hydrolase [Thermoplasmata archaeon]|nr:HAD family hydrolase [Thermoplasmata archaeon]
MSSRRVVFTDRDGTLNPDFHYLREPERFEFLPGVVRALQLLHEHGHRVVCVTNQSGVGRGFFSEPQLLAIHRTINERLERSATRVDAFYYCPHLPTDGCRCRKPGTELFERAARDLDIDLRSSAIIGDRVMDIEVGSALGMLSVLVPERGLEERTNAELRERGIEPDLRAESFGAAALQILSLG